MRALAGAVTLLITGALAGCSGLSGTSEAPPSDGGASTSARSPDGTATPAEGGGVFELSSRAFEDGQPIPTRFAGEGVSGGRNVSIPLSWRGAPPGTRSFAIAVVDRHPVARDWVHWLITDLPASSTSLAEGASGTPRMPDGARELRNTGGEVGWFGPTPPRGSGPHDYEVTVYALDVPRLTLAKRPSLADLESALEGHTLATAVLVGTFER